MHWAQSHLLGNAKMSQNIPGKLPVHLRLSQAPTTPPPPYTFNAK